MYNKAISYIKGGTTLDLYSGTGTLSMLASISSKEVMGIEVVKDAVKDANNNIELNAIPKLSKLDNQLTNVCILRYPYKNIYFIYILYG